MTNLDRRLKFHQILCDILGNSYVYFQPPESVKLHYPCIVYNRATGSGEYADNQLYTFRIAYEVIYISKDPDNEVILKLIALPYSAMNRSYTANNLNHDSFNIYF